MKIALKRVYDEPGPGDGLRILVDRLWPRGLSKENAHLDAWLKDVAPSNTLRQWYRHDPEKWLAFRQQYRIELDANADVVDALAKLIRHRNSTLLFAARDPAHNNAVVLKEYLENRGLAPE